MPDQAPFDSLGQRIAEERERANMTQGLLAQLVGLDRIKVNKIENGRRDVSHTEALLFAAALGLDVADLAPAPAPIQFRGRSTTPAADEAIALFKTFVGNWQTIEALRSIDAD